MTSVTYFISIMYSWIALQRKKIVKFLKILTIVIFVLFLYFQGTESYLGGKAIK